MRLTLMTDYALRLLMHVAQRPERLCTISEISQAYGISEAHMMKVTHQLAQQGWIKTVRGKGGGMRLAHEPQQINLGAVVRGMEPDFALVECFTNDNRCMLAGDCRLTGLLQGALHSFMAHLDGFTLATLLIPQASANELPPLSVIRLRREAMQT
ncbi:Rrf2 family transcriptional regulator [Comamonas testosteroni]|uniref:Transcriptional regulator, BadM/Rrf2 family n=2 Tax=Comamonas testosteroni TaxID=285 RepID=B7WQX3_COMTK|nr:Rrf2 family transcriptional regulator [Comamonas testosteroni]EED67118.1 transcriptional regulator, BadM/Rrf2 family [Comamonas testosteroni KF-1]WQG65311.1 Rrf2 family transcriptional regulator [Comamonas testosteroni]